MTDPAEDRLLSGEIWSTFCDLLRDAGDEILRPGMGDPLDVAEGYRMLTRLLRGALEGSLEWGDPLRPHLICTCHETIKIVAENPDNLYLGSSVSGSHGYRVWGTRGEAQWLSFNTFARGGFGGGGPGVGATLHEREMDLDEDGRFELYVTAERRGRNWLRLDPETSSLVIRQTFRHKGSDQPAELHIERLDDDGTPPEPLSAPSAWRSRSSMPGSTFAASRRSGPGGPSATGSNPTSSSTCNSRTPAPSPIRRSSGTRRTTTSSRVGCSGSSSCRLRATTG